MGMLTDTRTESSPTFSDTSAIGDDDFLILDLITSEPASDLIMDDITNECKPVEGWADGNLAIVTADKRCIQVDRHHLLAASDRFVEGLRDDPAAITIAVDSDTLTTYLNFVIRTPGKIDIPLDGDTEPFTPMAELTQFMVDYGCRRDLQHFRCWVICALHDEDLSPLVAFSVGAIMDDANLCVKALEAAKGWVWAEGNEHGEDDHDFAVRAGSGGANILDPNHLPFGVWNRLPREYVWALTRVSGLHETDKDGDDEGPDPEEFKVLLLAVKQRKNPKTKGTTTEAETQTQQTKTNVSEMEVPHVPEAQKPNIKTPETHSLKPTVQSKK